MFAGFGIEDVKGARVFGDNDVAEVIAEMQPGNGQFHKWQLGQPAVELSGAQIPAAEVMLAEIEVDQFGEPVAMNTPAGLKHVVPWFINGNGS